MGIAWTVTIVYVVAFHLPYFFGTPMNDGEFWSTGAGTAITQFATGICRAVMNCDGNYMPVAQGVLGLLILIGTVCFGVFWAVLPFLPCVWLLDYLVLPYTEYRYSAKHKVGLVKLGFRVELGGDPERNRAIEKVLGDESARRALMPRLLHSFLLTYPTFAAGKVDPYNEGERSLFEDAMMRHLRPIVEGAGGGKIMPILDSTIVGS